MVTKTTRKTKVSSKPKTTARKAKKNASTANSIFISWSGDDSKDIALKLKEALENGFDNKLSCFVSNVDIASGSDWWNKIQDQLAESSMGIMCITEENSQAPWIYFEAGALVAKKIDTIPLLFNCSIKDLEKTPLRMKQAVNYDNIKAFRRMIGEINTKYHIFDTTTVNISYKATTIQETLSRDIDDIVNKLKLKGFINKNQIYPDSVKTIVKKTVFISAPMSTLTEKQYEEQQKFLKRFVKTLKSIGFKDVISPAEKIKEKKKFDGYPKSVNDNFRDLKRAECFILIYSFPKASSSLIELGYAIALGKKTVVFYKKELPFLIRKAGEVIPHLQTVQYKKYDDITMALTSNKMALFGFKEENE